MDIKVGIDNILHSQTSPVTITIEPVTLTFLVICGMSLVASIFIK